MEWVKLIGTPLSLWACIWVKPSGTHLCQWAYIFARMLQYIIIKTSFHRDAKVWQKWSQSTCFSFVTWSISDVKGILVMSK